MTFIGIDVSKAQLEVAVLCEDGEIQRGRFTNHAQGHESLVVWLKRFPEVQVALEATGSYHQRLSAVLQAQGVYLSVLNPAQVSYYVKSQQRRNKTDKADALWIALYVKERQPVATASSDLSRNLLPGKYKA